MRALFIYIQTTFHFTIGLHRVYIFIAFRNTSFVVSIMQSSSSTSHKREFIKNKGNVGMTTRHQGRIQMSVQIRKAKKSQLLTLKRKYHSSVGHDDLKQQRCDSSLEELVELVSNYLGGGIVNNNSLHPLQIAISICSSDALDMLLQFLTASNISCSSSALSLINRLASTLLDDNQTNEERLDAAKVLTNFAATTTKTTAKDSDDDDHIYGGTANMKEWCYIMLQSNALYALLQVVSNFCWSSRKSDGWVNNATATTLCEQCCWAIANIAGDSYRSRMAILENQSISSEGGIVVSVPTLLLDVLHIGMKSQSAGLCRNSIWAISNLLRGPSSAVTHHYFLPVDNNTNSSLQPKDVIHLLVAPEIFVAAGVLPKLQGTSVVSWNEVALEACWMVSFLTSKDDEVVNYLCRYIGSNLPWTTIFQALEVRLRAATEAVKNNDNILQLNGTAGNAAIPCIRSISNIAMACDGSYIPNLIASSSLMQSLATLIEIGAIGIYTSNASFDIQVIASEAAWSAGSLLFFCLEQSSAAYRVLIPSLCTALVSNSSVLSLKREAVSSLVNAVSLPSSTVANDSTTVEVRNALLLEILKIDKIIPVIVQLLSNTDMETVVMALHLVNASFRRLNLHQEALLIRQQFEECSILDALEGICERVASVQSTSSNINISSFAADVAADLVDDFFSDEIFSKEEELLEVEESSTSAFKFGSNPDIPFTWNSTDAANISLSNHNESVNIRKDESISSSTPVAPRTMRGGGRGISNIPSWMQQP